MSQNSSMDVLEAECGLDICSGSEAWSSYLVYYGIPPLLVISLIINARKLHQLRQAMHLPCCFYLQAMTAINVALIIPFAYYYFQKTYSSCSWIKSIDTIRAERQPLIKNQPLWEEVLVYVWRVLHSQPDYDIGELDFCAINLPEMNGTQFCTHHYPSLFVDGLLEWLMVSADFCLIFYSLERLRNLVQSFSRFRPRWFKSSVYVVVVGGFLAVALVQVVQAVVEREIEMKNWVVTLELLEVFDNKAANLTEYKRRMTDLKKSSALPFLIQTIRPCILRGLTFILFFAVNISALRYAWLQLHYPHSPSQSDSNNFVYRPPRHRRRLRMYHIIGSIVFYFLGHAPRLAYLTVDFWRTKKENYCPSKIFTYQHCVFDDLSRICVLVYYSLCMLVLAPVRKSRQQNEVRLIPDRASTSDDNAPEVRCCRRGDFKIEILKV